MGWGHEEARMKKSVYDADDDTFVDAAEGLRETGGPTTLAIGAVGDGEVLRRNASTAVGIARAGIDTDSVTHIASDGTDHANVVLNDTHRASNGTDHANVVTNDAHVAGDGSDHADVATNTTHSSGDGSDHADVATNSAARHTQGTDQGLDTGGANAVTAAQAKAASDHVSADGSSHADVATNSTHVAGDGSDHADVATNTTHSSGNGSDHANVALNDTHRASDGTDHANVVLADTHRGQVLGAGHTGTLAQLNAGITDSSLRPCGWDATFAETFDYQAGGDGSQDGTDLIYAYCADMANVTALETAGGTLTFSVTGAGGASRDIWMVKRLDAVSMADLKDAAGFFAYFDFDLSALGTVGTDAIQVWIANQDMYNTTAGEYVVASLEYDGADRECKGVTARNGAESSSVTAGGIAGWANSGRLWVRSSAGVCTAGFTEGNNNDSPTRITFNNWHTRVGGANAPYLLARMVGRAGGGQVIGTSTGLGCIILG